jgi:uncharacterized protein (DUF1778 family)
MSKITLNLRVNTETKAMLEGIAKKESRSLTNTVEWLISREYENTLKKEAESK